MPSLSKKSVLSIEETIRATNTSRTNGFKEEAIQYSAQSCKIRFLYIFRNF
jgi:hypothetical protein